MCVCVCVSQGIVDDHYWPITTCCAVVAVGHFRSKADSGRLCASLSEILALAQMAAT